MLAKGKCFINGEELTRIDETSHGLANYLRRNATGPLGPAIRVTTVLFTPPSRTKVGPLLHDEDLLISAG